MNDSNRSRKSTSNPGASSSIDLDRDKRHPKLKRQTPPKSPISGWLARPLGQTYASGKVRSQLAARPGFSEKQMRVGERLARCELCFPALSIAEWRNRIMSQYFIRLITLLWSRTTP